MHFNPTYHSYERTGAFSKLVVDYLNNEPALEKFYSFRPDLAGIKKAIESKSKNKINRKLLVDQLKAQYVAIKTSDKVLNNIKLLADENTFTVCTAHQPNVLTGPLYFIYKIVHVIKLADELNASINNYHFVPVYYMGSEDADLDELGHLFVNGVLHQWKTLQKGAVGRMEIDDDFLKMIDNIERQLVQENYGAEIITTIKRCYNKGKSLAMATFEFVDSLFNAYGLLILLPDNHDFKAVFKEVIRKELLGNHSSLIVDKTIAEFPKQYKIQTSGRKINLFYLKDDIRERIENVNGNFKIVNTDIHFTPKEILQEAEIHPERFSPNVILRPLFQEMILPNVAFVGGGGELSYWMELKSLFDVNSVAFPVLILRNSFTIINSKINQSIHELGFAAEDFFDSVQVLNEKYVKATSEIKLLLTDEENELRRLYDNIKKIASEADETLSKHVDALFEKSSDRIKALAKKMLRAEKKKQEVGLRKIEKIKNRLYPNGHLQERMDNFLQFQSVYGNVFISEVLQHSASITNGFCTLEED